MRKLGKPIVNLRRAKESDAEVDRGMAPFHMSIKFTLNMVDCFRESRFMRVPVMERGAIPNRTSTKRDPLRVHATIVDVWTAFESRQAS